MHIIAAKAVAFLEALKPQWKDYAQSIITNAKALSDGLQAGGHHIVSGGTDTHLFLLSLVDREITGKAAEAALGLAGITANKNMVPFDPRKPAVTSGVRLGTPAVTTRGMGAAEMREVATLISRVLAAPEDVAALEQVRADVTELCGRFPLYPARVAE
jgi:glycine hydroxymethyltransferase